MADQRNDMDFDAFWEEESRNKTRNRIRVGRQYQATVPSLLKPGESDNRKLEDLETLRWKPSAMDDDSDTSLNEYMSMAKAVSVFSKVLQSGKAPLTSMSVTSNKEGQTRCENLDSAIRGLTEFVMSHHPCHRDAGCKMASRTQWTVKEAELLAKALAIVENEAKKNIEKAGATGAVDDDESCDSDVEMDEYATTGQSDSETASLGGSSSVGHTAHTKGSSSKGSATPPVISNADVVDVNPPSEIKPIPARIIRHHSDSQLGSSQAAGSMSVDGTNSSQETTGAKTSGGSGTNPGSGSLKFYLGGELVLKLSAKQDSKTWVESNDTPVVSSHNSRRKTKKVTRSCTTSAVIAWPERGSPSQESSSSIESHSSSTPSSLQGGTPHTPLDLSSQQ